MSLTGQFFVESDYQTFTADKACIDTNAVRQERQLVKNKLLVLDEQLWPFVAHQGWDLHRHRHANHYTSSDHFIPGSDGGWIVNNIHSMWLHYGKSVPQLDFLKEPKSSLYGRTAEEEAFNAFYLHSRIQVYINERCCRSWLLYATDRNLYDRKELHWKLVNPAERDKFWELICGISNRDYQFDIDGERLPLTSELKRDEFERFLKFDIDGVYSGIYKEYSPEDKRISNVDFVEEIERTFEDLYPLYDYMSRRVLV